MHEVKGSELTNENHELTYKMKYISNSHCDIPFQFKKSKKQKTWVINHANHDSLNQSEIEEILKILKKLNKNASP